MLKDLYLPAEWEQQSLVMLTWPHQATDWQPYLREITETYIQMADAITRHEALVIATPHPIQVGALLGGRLSKEQMTNVFIYYCKTNDTWARDHGPITIKDRGEGKKTLLDFRFNGWGEKFEADLDNKITKTLFEEGAFDTEETGTPRLVDNDDFVLEGGSIESDGQGTVFTTEHCLMAPNRNQPLSKEEIESELKYRLKAKRIVWLTHGLIEGDDTDGHIDTIVRLAPDNTVLYHKYDDENDAAYQDFILLEEELKALRTIDGEPYKLIPLYAPKAIYDGEDRLPATYANFLVINEAVLVPTYGQAEYDDMACKAVAQAFTDREIIPVDSQTIVRQHGSIHCCTMQLPK